MAQPFVTGAVYLAYTFRGGSNNTLNGQTLFIGTAERSPQIQIRKSWMPLFNDLGGPSIPFDMSYAGEEAFISADITRWNESVYASLTAGPFNLGNRGFDINGDIGTLMMTENAAGALTLVFPYTSLKPLTYGTQPFGYYFRRAWLEGPDILDPLGTQPRKTRLVWRALREFSLSDSGVDPTFRLYDNVVPAVTIN